MSQFWKYFARLVGVSWALALVVVLFWTVYPYQVSDVAQPIEILNENNEIAVGENIRMRIIVDKPNNIKPSGSVFIVCTGGNLIIMVGQPQDIPIGKHELINEKYKLPDKVSVGDKCRFVFNNKYQVNFIRSVSREWQSEQFTVKKE